MRRKLVVGNWKMNLTLAEATACVETFVREVDRLDSVDVGLAPTFLALHAVAGLLAKTHILVGAQDVFWAEKGAFTGKVGPGMLKDAGAKFCLVGHSEPRGRFGKLEVPETTISYFAETEETINLKIKALLYAGLKPILCVGETQAERDANQTDAVIKAQLAGAFEGLDSSELSEIVIAYEPVWAIGTGKVCDSQEANRVIGAIREALRHLLEDGVADRIQILYGGSVKASNAKELFEQPEIDGGLVGGASLDPHEFAKIVKAAAR